MACYGVNYLVSFLLLPANNVPFVTSAKQFYALYEDRHQTTPSRGIYRLQLLNTRSVMAQFQLLLPDPNATHKE